MNALQQHLVAVLDDVGRQLERLPASALQDLDKRFDGVRDYLAEFRHAYHGADLPLQLLYRCSACGRAEIGTRFETLGELIAHYRQCHRAAAVPSATSAADVPLERAA